MTIEIFNLVGQRVRQLVNAVNLPGTYEVRWDGLNERGQQVPSGIYFYRIKSGEFRQTKRMLLVR